MPEDEEKWVKLQTEIPVRLLYHTAFLETAASSSGPTSMAGTTILRRRSVSSPGRGRKSPQREGDDIGP